MIIIFPLAKINSVIFGWKKTAFILSINFIISKRSCSCGRYF
jgi:hypothetical protein